MMRYANNRVIPFAKLKDEKQTFSSCKDAIYNLILKKKYRCIHLMNKRASFMNKRASSLNIRIRENNQNMQ